MPVDGLLNGLGATLFHLAINLTSALAAGLVLSFSLPFMMAYGVIAAVIAAVVVFVRRDLFFGTPCPEGLLLSRPQMDVIAESGSPSSSPTHRPLPGLDR